VSFCFEQVLAVGVVDAVEVLQASDALVAKRGLMLLFEWLQWQQQLHVVLEQRLVLG
jgi:hypothetical protein